MVRSILLFTIFFQLFIYADDVRFKNGNILYNVQIIQTTGQYYVVKTSADNITLFRDEIESVDRKPLTDPFLSFMLKKDGTKKYYSDNDGRPEVMVSKTKRPHLLLIPASIALGVLAREYFDTASNISDVKYKNRYTIYGVIFGLSSVATLIYSLQSVIVTTDGRSISVSYNF